ncbi:MAG: TerC family protein [Isosphaeraceae bacterium]|nr:TerC family protein [Isosphaeraceae bacterium]
MGFSPAEWSSIFVTIATLVFLEGLLSADNALVLAVMVRHLPKNQQRRALRYGIIGAFFFRFVAILFAATLLEYWWFEVVGGLYLFYLAVSHLCFGGDHSDDPEAKARPGKGFWGTVVGVEIADIAFSIDSILAAVAMADVLPKKVASTILFDLPFGGSTVTMKMAVIYIGGILGILAMRFVAGYFLILLDKFSGLALGAYYLVGWIGLKLIGGGLHHGIHPTHEGPSWSASLPEFVKKIPLHMPGWFFWSGMAIILAGSFLYRPKPKQATEPGRDVIVELPDSGDPKGDRT